MKKLGLSTKFPKYMLYPRKSAGRVGLLQSKIILVIIVMKQYIADNRVVAKAIKIVEDWTHMISRYSKKPIEIK